MKFFKPMALAGIFLLLLTAWLVPFASRDRTAYAQSQGTITPTPSDDNPPRKTNINVQYTTYYWWLIRYSNNQIACSFSIEHEGMPNSADIEAFCPSAIFTEWQKTKPCDLAVVGEYSKCPGFYLLPVGSKPGERTIEVELAKPSVWISVANCNSNSTDGRCTTLPSLVLEAEEPLPNESIISIQGTLGGDPFSCMGAVCTIPLRPTGLDGILVEFWADSSFGDSSEHYTARVRLVPWGDFVNPEGASSDAAQWYIDILSSQWRDGALPSCSDTWQVFPPVGGPAEWLRSPTNQTDLGSDISYYYLAGSLITYGVVDASGCLDGGLQAPNIASPCGVEAARPQLVEWQNRFDAEIMLASNQTGVPARLLKNVFSRESQIWPGIYKTYKEAGLGQLTENGADTVLLWNPDFFSQFCPLVLNQAYCDLGWGNLKEPEQNLLKGALVSHVNASCPDCPAGIDLSQANFSVRVFAEGMLANCEQVGRMITNLTGQTPGQSSTYEDLWRFTLVNYNAGPGCLLSAMRKAQTAGAPLDWPNISANLDPVCQAAIGYVEDITRALKPTPTPTTWLPFSGSQPTPVLPRVLMTTTPTPQIRRSPTPTASNTPTVTLTPILPTPTITPTNTPGPSPTTTP
jgi:hypothetical protein